MRERTLYGSLMHIAALALDLRYIPVATTGRPTFFRDSTRVVPSRCYAPYGTDPNSREARRRVRQMQAAAEKRVRRQLLEEFNCWPESPRTKPIPLDAMREQLGKAEGPFVNG